MTVPNLNSKAKFELTIMHPGKKNSYRARYSRTESEFLRSSRKHQHLDKVVLKQQWCQLSDRLHQYNLICIKFLRMKIVNSDCEF